jgi:hypothetical protein
MYGVLDKFLWRVFSVAKVVSAIIVAVCLIVAIFSGLGLIFGGGKSFEIPSFSSLKEQIEEENDSKRSKEVDYKSFDLRREIEKEYGDEIEKIIKEFKLPTNAYDFLIEKLVNMKEEYRDKFVEGLWDFLDDARDYIEDKGKNSKISIIGAARYYLNAFDNEIQTVEASKVSAQKEKVYLLATFGGSLIIMLGFLLIPLLIQIEKNTRKVDTA